MMIAAVVFLSALFELEEEFMKRVLVLSIVLLLAPAMAEARKPLMRRALARAAASFKRMSLKGCLTSLGNSAVGRTTRRAVMPVMGPNGRSLGRRDRRAHLGHKGWLDLKPVARNFTSRRARLSYASGLLNRSLTAQQQSALIQAHLVGKGEKGTTGRRAQISASGKGNYTFAQLRKKALILRRAGFSKQETRMLMERGVVGMGNVLTGASLIGSGIVLGLMDMSALGLPKFVLGVPSIAIGGAMMTGMFGEY